MTTIEFLKKVVVENNFSREVFEEKKIPTEKNDLLVVPFFGDLRSLVLLSSWFLKRYKQANPDKYIVVVSWPGYSGLFGYADEYWSTNSLKLFENSDGFRNTSDFYTVLLQGLNENFRNVADHRKVVEPYYDNKLTQNFWDTYEQLEVYFPYVSSAAILGQEFTKDSFSKQNRILLSPFKTVQSWRNGKNQNNPVDKKFWLSLAEFLLSKNYLPIVWQNDFSHDLSPDLLDKVVYINEKNVSKIMAAMRSSTLVLDVFGGISRLAIASRSPFLAVDERSRWSGVNEGEFDDLCFNFLPREYIFTFSTIVSEGGINSWSDLFENIAVKVDRLISKIDRNKLPSTGEYDETVSYSSVRKNKNKKIGTRLLKIKERD